MDYGQILVVDDDPTILAKLRKILEPSYKIVVATNGRDALKIAQRQLPSLILMDIDMPDMSGYRVCDRLKLDVLTQNIPVIFITASNDSASEEAAFSKGCVDYLVKPLAANLVLARIKNHLSLVRSSELNRSYQDAIHMLADACQYNDDDTGDHIWRMASYCSRLGKAMGWSGDECDLLKLAASMHDAGKIGIPDRVLKKPGKLDSDEWTIMQSHTRIGHKLLSRSDAPVFKLAAEIALSHHERWDGRGYPEGLSGHEIPESARIVKIVDVFDALSMKRAYKEPWQLKKIIEYIHAEAGKQFDAGIVSCFMSNLPKIMRPL